METPTAEAPSALTPRVLVFFDYACQFCYLDWPRFKRLRAEHDCEVFLVPYELRPALPAEGVPIEEVGHHSERVQEHMRRMADEYGLPLIFPSFVPNTHYALALGEFARDLGPEAHEALHEAIMEAYNGREEDIGREDVLLRIAEDHALDPKEVRRVFHEGRYDERLHDFFHMGLSMGVSATPSALICNELFIGTRPYRVLEESVERCLITPERIIVGSAFTSLAEEPVRRATHNSEGQPPAIDR